MMMIVPTAMVSGQSQQCTLAAGEHNAFLTTRLQALRVAAAAMVMAKLAMSCWAAVVSACQVMKRTTAAAAAATTIIPAIRIASVICRLGRCTIPTLAAAAVGARLCATHQRAAFTALALARTSASASLDTAASNAMTALNVLPTSLSFKACTTQMELQA